MLPVAGLAVMPSGKRTPSGRLAHVWASAGAGPSSPPSCAGALPAASANAANDAAKSFLVMVSSSRFIIGAMTRMILCLWLAIATGCASVSPPAPVAVRLVAFNDFHGHIETAPRLATAVREMKSGHAHTAVVAAGDLVGASPPAPSFFLERPAISVLSDIGLELSSLGNHEFDRGREHLERLQHGAHFTYLAANVYDRGTGRPFIHPYAIRFFGGIPVAFIGAVLHGTTQVVSASGIRTLEFRDEADSVNAIV